jgi:T5SS/PEP-CTERM-associated repeat protein
MRRGCVIAGFLFWIAVDARSSRAQYTADFQTNIISGVSSNWIPDYYVGNTNFGDALVIQSSGVLSNGLGFLGYNVSSSNNSALVTGAGSVWSNRWGLYIGYSGAGNSLVISEDGEVISDPSGSNNYADYIGFNASSSNNTVVVTGSGSVWYDGQRLHVGFSGAGNSLVISNGGQVFSTHLNSGPASGYIGSNSSSISNRVLVTDPGSTWNNDGTLIVGYGGNANTLVISNGGLVASSGGRVGGIEGTTGSWSNSVVVTGVGSVWSNTGTLSVGPSKEGVNSLTISDGGKVISTYGLLTSPSNNVLITGAGSVWSNGNVLAIGGFGRGNSLVISNGGQVIDETGGVGFGPGFGSGSGNRARVVSKGIWENNGLTVGDLGSSNSLTIAAGTVSATNLVIGAESTTCDNFVQLDSGSLLVTNANATAVLEVRHGVLIMNGGVLRADTLVMTNSCASLVHTGGTLIVGSVVLDPNTFRIVSVTRQGNDMLITWMMGPGATNTLQVTAGNGSGGYNTNGFADIFIVTNNTAIGTVTNYLDIGAATNAPARYYRARLVP